MNPIIRRRNTGRLERQALRRLREGTAGLLVEKVPALTGLSIAMHETSAETGASETRYTRRVVLEQASSLLEVRCSNSHCDEGVYDLTGAFHAALAAGEPRFEGACPCSGDRGACGRVLHYVATATYRPRPGARPAEAAPAPPPAPRDAPAPPPAPRDAAAAAPPPAARVNPAPAARARAAPRRGTKAA